MTVLPFATGAAALMLYAKGFVRLRRRRRTLAPAWQAAAFASGLAVALLGLALPLGEERLLTAHMAQHLLLADVAPLLLVAGLRAPMLFFALPRELLRALAGIEPLRRAVAFLLRPVVALTVWAAATYAWHVPALYGAALGSPALHTLEHASFFLAGLLVWTAILDPARRRVPTPGRRAAFAGVVLLAGFPLGDLLVATGPLYDHYAQLADRPFGLSAAEDQTRAGLLMMAEQIATLGAAAALLLWSHAERAAAATAGFHAPNQGRPG